MNIILLFETDKTDGNRFVLKDERAKHIRTILKAGQGDTLEIGMLNGPVGTAVIDKIDSDEIILLNPTFKPQEKTDPIIDVICALPRPQTVKKVLFISAMMGVRNLSFIRANRVEKSYFHSPLLEDRNYLRFLYDGLSQGKKTELPHVTIHDKFKPFFEDKLPSLYDNPEEPPLMLLPDLDTENSMDKIYNKQNKHLIVAIGPEGGWVPFEINLMESLGFQRFKLGNWTLRVEHALTACLSQVELVQRM